MKEVLLVTGIKDSGGIAVLDFSNGSAVCNNFKNCTTGSGTISCIGSNTSSFSGYGSTGDYLAVSQNKKPLISIWQWGKPQIHFQCHVQEITTALATDMSGSFLIAGTANGWLYCWDVSSGQLLRSWQAHFSSVSRVYITSFDFQCVSTSEDGTGKVWDLTKILDRSNQSSGLGSSSVSPFRQWSAHTLPIKDMCVFDSLNHTRVVTCSSDRTLALYDVQADKTCLKLSFPDCLLSVTSNSSWDTLCLGSAQGSIYVVNLSLAALASSVADKAAVVWSGDGAGKGGAGTFLMGSSSRAGKGKDRVSGGVTTGGLESHTSVLEGHLKAVVSLAFSTDNVTLVSASSDGTLRWWNIWTRQCLRELSPLQNCPLTNVKAVFRPEILSLGSVVKPFLAPVQHLKKYVDLVDKNDKGEKLITSCVGPVLLSQNKENHSFQSEVPLPVLLQNESGNNNTEEKESNIMKLSRTPIDLKPQKSTRYNETKEDPTEKENLVENEVENEAELEKRILHEINNDVEELKLENQRWKFMCQQLTEQLMTEKQQINTSVVEENKNVLGIFEDEDSKVLNCPELRKSVSREKTLAESMLSSRLKIAYEELDELTSKHEQLKHDFEKLSNGHRSSNSEITRKGEDIWKKKEENLGAVVQKESESENESESGNSIEDSGVLNRTNQADNKRKRQFEGKSIKKPIWVAFHSNKFF